MFDEVQKTNEPEDIFAGTENAEGATPPPRPEAPTSGPMPAMSGERPSTPPPAPPTGGMPTPPPPTMPSVPTPKGSGGTLKVVLIVLIVILVIVAAGLISYFLLNRAPAENIQVDPEVILEDDMDLINLQPSEEVVEEEVVTPAPEPSSSFDTDRDGLSDVRETELGTSPKISDTDADGLSDYEEVMTWKTNPLNPDTDGDTFLDGDEVSNGYDPAGSGKLTDLPTTTE